MISAELFDKIKLWQLEKNILAENAGDAIVLTSGIGLVSYLTRDGRVLVEGDGIVDSSPLEDAEPDEASTFLVHAARFLELPELLQLVEPAPPAADDCDICQGTRWSPRNKNVVCFRCHGKGWLAPPTSQCAD
ncbi:MAG: hypothetical protein AB7S38_01570 [Vulcanimicrobiota bacterium]